MSKTISKHVLEVRYKPDPRFLDRRGEIAGIISRQQFDQWNIGSNRIEFASKKHLGIGAFFSYRNLGFFSEYPVLTDDFNKKAKEFFKSTWTYFPTNQITRIGVRSTFLVESKNFKAVFDKYKSLFLGLKDEHIKKFGGDLIDLGFPLNFAIGEEFFNIITGPMEKKQSKEFVMDADELPETGVYIDVDYFRKEFSPYITQKNIMDLIDRGVEKAKEIKNEILNLIIK